MEHNVYFQKKGKARTRPDPFHMDKLTVNCINMELYWYAISLKVFNV